MSTHRKSVQATAFPGRDAPRADPAAGVKSQQAGKLNLRNLLHVGCWNVRTLLHVGSQNIALRNLHDYKVDICCLSETRIPHYGSKSVKIPASDRLYWLYHSGPSDNSGLHGVDFALSERAHKALITWRPISSRSAVARFKGSPTNMTVIAVYAPTFPSDDSGKDEFYEQLQKWWTLRLAVTSW